MTPQATATRRDSAGLGRAYGDTLEIELAPGELGIATTIEAMRAVAIEAASYSPIVQRIASTIVADAPRRNTKAQLEGLWTFLRAGIHFRHDTWRREHLRTPDQLLLEIAQAGRTSADCDDVATLGASLLLAMGYQALFIIVSRRADRTPQHVFFGAIIKGQHVPLDPQEGYPVGVWPKATRRDVIVVER